MTRIVVAILIGAIGIAVGLGTMMLVSAYVEPTRLQPSRSTGTPIRTEQSLTVSTPTRVEQAKNLTPTRVPTSTSTPRPAALSRALQLAWFYRPPRNSDALVLSRYVDFFILTRLDETTRNSLLELDPDKPILQYLLLNAIRDPGGCTQQPYYDQVAFYPGDFCEIKKTHPDWFLRDVSGNLIFETDQLDGTQYVRMDPGNPGWRAFWIERAMQSQDMYGWRGIFLDNVEASRSGFTRRSTALQAYTTDAEFQAQNEAFLDFLATNYTHARHSPLFGNITELADPSVWQRYLNYLDGAMQEAFAVDWEDDYLSTRDWEEQMVRMEGTQERGKQVILVSQGPRTDQVREQFALASYLLINLGKAYFRYTHYDAYEELWLYPNYELDLGNPVGRRYRSGTTWQRDFAKGSVRVDPTAHTASITVR